MIKVKALQKFTYKDFKKIKNLVRNNKNDNLEGTLYTGDTFECTDEMSKYLTGECGYVLVKVIEIIPKEKVVEIEKSDIISDASKLKDEDVIDVVVEKVKKTPKKSSKK